MNPVIRLIKVLHFRGTCRILSQILTADVRFWTSGSHPQRKGTDERTFLRREHQMWSRRSSNVCEQMLSKWYNPPPPPQSYTEECMYINGQFYYLYFDTTVSVNIIYIKLQFLLHLSTSALTEDPQLFYVKTKLLLMTKYLCLSYQISLKS